MTTKEQAQQKISDIFNDLESFDFYGDPERNKICAYDKGQIKQLIDIFEIDYELLLKEEIHLWESGVYDLPHSWKLILEVLKKELSDQRRGR